MLDSNSNSTWFCQSDGTFATDEPDRSECTHSWINEIKDMV